MEQQKEERAADQAIREHAHRRDQQAEDPGALARRGVERGGCWHQLHYRQSSICRLRRA